MKFKLKGSNILILFFPYLIALSILCIFTEIGGKIIERVFQNNGLILLAILIVIYIIALICSIVNFFKNIISVKNAQEILYTNMIIKLVQIPAYVFIFFVGLMGLFTIFTMAISIVLLVLDSLTIFLTGLIGLSGIIKGCSEHKISKKESIFHGMFQFIFCLDIISCIWLYKRVEKLSIT